MKEKIIINIKSQEEINQLSKYGITHFLAPLKDFCVGYDCLDVDAINNLSGNIYLLVNRILTNNDLHNLKIILDSLNNIKGVFFEDLGVFELIKDKDIEKIYFPNHFGTNYASINTFFDKGIDSMVVSNEITLDEVKEIADKVSKEVILQVFGYNQIMYSRRNLISNFNKEYDLDLALDNEITDKVTKKNLKIKENKYGTVIYDDLIYNNLELLDIKNNIKFYYINSTYITLDDIINVLEHKDGITSKNGFLNQKTIFKVGEKHEKA